MDFLVSEVRGTTHRDDDDLLSAGLGLAGLRGLPPPYFNPLAPTPAELRRRAIQASWKGVADLGPLGGYGRLYGGAPAVPGREYQAFARVAGASQPHRVLLQAPDHFDVRSRCLVVSASSGSRGIYGAIALAGAWGLPRGCAVVYTDKGAGSGYFDTDTGTGVALDGRRRLAGEAVLEFEPTQAAAGTGIAVKHAHSTDHPEADWGRHVLQAARFGLAMLDRAYPQQAPFTPENTRIIATGLSNGGGAVLQAAGLDGAAMFDALVALEPNVHVDGHGRSLFDFASEASLWLPCALTAADFAAVPFARTAGMAPPPWLGRGAGLRQSGWIDAATPARQAQEALAYLRRQGWRDEVLASAACSTAWGLWRAIGAAYACAYLRRPVGRMPAGFGYAAVAGPLRAVAAASWWADAAGLPPGDGIMLTGDDTFAFDPALRGDLALRALWEQDGDPAATLRASVRATAAGLPHERLPIWIVHGAEDGLLPPDFTSDPYIAWLRAHARTPRYWRIPHAQHFDAGLALPGFGERYVPLLAYAYAALDRSLDECVRRLQPAPVPTPAPRRRGLAPLQAGDLDLPGH